MTNLFAEPSENTNISVRAIEKRQEEILVAISHQRAVPSPALLEELAELSIALDDMPEVSNDLHQP